ncbi:MAG TPA: FtsX-like permease family protein [Blastocatellia bacterium]|nr:FtsX-like permease family protein [Blastocatellia bacterium]
MPLPLKYNFRNLVVRKGTTIATALSLGITIAVFLMVMALAKGIDLTLETSGEPLNLLVLRNGSTAELNSDVTRENLNNLQFLDGIGRDGDQPKVAPEIVTVIYKAHKGETQGGNVTIRGVTPMSSALRTGFNLVQGRMLKYGLAEAVVSKRMSDRFQGLDIGDKFKVGSTEYSIVGIFEAGGKTFESEIWADVNSLRNALNRESYSSVLIRAKDSNALAALAKRITNDPQLQLKAEAEQDFYLEQQGPTTLSLKILAAFIAIIMSIGAGFAGMNTMYAAVAQRTREIGTLRVLGFGRASILTSFVLEALVIAVIGVAIGVLLSLPLNFVSAGTSNNTTFSEVAFNFRVTPWLIAIAFVFGIAVGLFGSVLPSVQAARFKIVDALRS